MDTLNTGAEILVQSLLNHHVNTIFGYPGSCVMSVLDCLYNYKGSINHVLVRHEQGAIHAAQGYAQASKKTGVALLTSGPGATNTVTGIVDALANATPLVIITGQVHSQLLGTDAFQEVDVIGITQSITKWVYQIRTANEIAAAVARAFHIASTGLPGPVVLDITKDAQVGKAIYVPQKVTYTRDVPSNNAADQVIELLAGIDQRLTLVLDIVHSYSFKYGQSFSKVIKSENFGTMGFGLPAAIGAKYATPDQTVCLIAGTTQFQATIQELGVVMQSGVDLKIILLNNGQDTKYNMMNPDFMPLIDAYGIKGKAVSAQACLSDNIQEMLHSKGAYLLEIRSFQKP